MKIARYADIPPFTRSASYSVSIPWKHIERTLESFGESCDNFDDLYRKSRSFHGDTCCCEDCKACVAYFYDLPNWKRCLAELAWGQP